MFYLMERTISMFRITKDVQVHKTGLRLLYYYLIYLFVFLLTVEA